VTYSATLAPVLNRGIPPTDFLDTIISTVNGLPDEVFAPNPNADIYGLIEPVLGPWDGTIIQRRAAMLEAMRVHAGFESSWNWDEGLDTTNPHSVENITQEEAGVFQVSYDSLYLDPSGGLFVCFNSYVPLPTSAIGFISAMKSNHPLAVEYYARLVRISIRWAGPLISVNGNPPAVLAWLSRAAMAEFQGMLQPS
jgi:hypothetical protein